MVRRIAWGRLAQKDRLQILHYWENQNKSKIFSKKLDGLFKQNLNLLLKYPFIGKRNVQLNQTSGLSLLGIIF